MQSYTGSGKHWELGIDDGSNCQMNNRNISVGVPKSASCSDFCRGKIEALTGATLGERAITCLWCVGSKMSKEDTE